MAFLDLGKMTQAIQVRDRDTAAALRMVENAINHLGKSTGAHPIGEPNPPDPIQNLNVKVSGEMAHAVISDQAPVQRNVQYFLEVANEPNFLAPYVEHLGTSRHRVITLPTNGDSTGTDSTTGLPTPGALNQWYFRAYSQYPGGKPSPRVNFGAPHLPTPVTMQGTTNLSLLPSTGSGTASGNGQQGGFGLGKFLNRSAVVPKRSVSSNAGR